jgi:ribonuclease BN (tRNA processing enzyme)
LSDGNATVTFLPDHEPALGVRDFPQDARWTSGYALAEGADLLIHDSQYTDEEYALKAGWGHTALSHAITFAHHTGAELLVAFHHDPTHSDEMLDALFADLDPDDVVPAREGQELVVGADAA